MKGYEFMGKPDHVERFREFPLLMLLLQVFIKRNEFVLIYL